MKNIRKNYIIYILSVLIYSSTEIPPVFAETGYVSDMLILSLKDGPGRQFNTIKTLRSDMPVDIIETTERFLKVKIEEGDIGWVESQYITKELPKALIIGQLNNKIAQLEGKNPTTQSDPVGVAKSENTINELEANKEAEYQNRIKSLEAALNRQIEKNILLQTQLNTSKFEQGQTKDQRGQNVTTINKLTIKEEDIPQNSNQKNSKANSVDIGDEASLFSETNMIVLPEDDVLKTAMIKWFCSGAAVLIAGWFIGRSFSGGRKASSRLLD